MRRNNKTSLAYMFRNFAKLFYVALPVAVLMAFFTNPNKEIAFYKTLFCGEFTSVSAMFGEFLRSFTVLRYGKYWWCALISLLVLALTISMLVVKISHHMHIGEMPALPFKKSFKLFPVTLLVIVCYFVIIEIIMLLSVGLMFIFRGINNIAAVATIGIAINVIMRVVCCWLFMLLVIALPLRYSENYHLNVAFAYSVRAMTKHNKAVWGSTLCYVLLRYVIMLVGYFLSPFNVDIVLYFVAFLFLIMFLPCLSYRLYYDVIGGERRDVSNVMYY